MSNDVTGKLTAIFNEEKISDKMRKREFVINIPGKYSKDICFQLINDRVDLIDKYSIGDTITVSYELSSREYKGKYYTQANAWKIQVSNDYKAFDDGNKTGSLVQGESDDLPW